MIDDVEPCPGCRQPIRPGAAYCASCGAPLRNRSAQRAQRLPQGNPDDGGAPGRQRHPIPGSIPVTQGPSTGSTQGGGAAVPATLEVVPADAGKRLGAAVLDWLPPLAVLLVMIAIGITDVSSGGPAADDTAVLVLPGCLAAGFAAAYSAVLWVIEARSGSTIGNRLMHIRTTDADGFAPGAGAVFIRGLITGAGAILAVLAAAIMVLIHWSGPAGWVLTGLGLLGLAWAVLVAASSVWDRNGKLRGWHDAAAKTLVFDIQAGRNPVTTGGVEGPYSFAPLDLPPVRPVASPAAQAPVAAQAPGAVQPSRAAAGAGRSPFQPASPVSAAHPDADLDRTQVRTNTGAPVTLALLRIRLDDGRDIELERAALIGRNPAGHPGEDSVQLIQVPDPGRSISKTHLHLQAGNGGIWVTDRNSTNGSAVTTPDGLRTALAAGEATHVRPGSTVHFGDRTFYLGQA